MKGLFTEPFETMFKLVGYRSLDKAEPPLPRLRLE